MLLRASGEQSGESVDLRAVTQGSAAPSGLAGGEALTAFAEAAVAGDPEVIADARARVQRELGDAATVDAAGVIGNFDRMVRIADATGIPLDKPVAMVSTDVRADLGLDDFEGAGNTASLNAVERWIGRLMARMLPVVLRRFRNR